MRDPEAMLRHDGRAQAVAMVSSLEAAAAAALMQHMDPAKVADMLGTMGAAQVRAPFPEQFTLLRRTAASKDCYFQPPNGNSYGAS